MANKDAFALTLPTVDVASAYKSTISMYGEQTSTHGCSAIIHSCEDALGLLTDASSLLPLLAMFFKRSPTADGATPVLPVSHWKCLFGMSDSLNGNELTGGRAPTNQHEYPGDASRQSLSCVADSIDKLGGGC